MQSVLKQVINSLPIISPLVFPTLACNHVKTGCIALCMYGGDADQKKEKTGVIFLYHSWVVHAGGEKGGNQETRKGAASSASRKGEGREGRKEGKKALILLEWHPSHLQHACCPSPIPPNSTSLPFSIPAANS